jgi:hypothetical protein
MANKEFKIQGNALSIGGVSLQAGTTSIVIPGVTQATDYRVDEVNDTGDQTITFTNFNGVIDGATYNRLVATPSDFNNPTVIAWMTQYGVSYDDAGYIDEIYINSTQGATYTAQEATTNSSTDMYAYVGTGGTKTLTSASYNSDVTALSVVKDGGGYKYISAQRANWAVTADYDLLEALPDLPVFHIVLGNGDTYTFTSTSRGGTPGQDVNWYGEFDPAPSGTIMEAPASITFGGLTEFVAQDWAQVPFRPKMKAGEIETIGGGSGGSSIANEGETLSIRTDGEVILDGPDGGVDRGVRWKYGSDNGGYDSFIRQDEGGFTIQSYADEANPDGTNITLRTTNSVGELKSIVLDNAGTTTFPGAVVKSTVTKVGANINGNDVVFEVTAVDGLGAVTELTVTNSPNPAWVSGTSGLSLTDVDFTVSFDGSGNASVTVNSSGNGHSVSETFYLQPNAVGAVAPTPTALDLTKSINKLTNNINDNDYTLADGVEGQIMYLVPTPNTVNPTDIKVLVNHARNGGTQSLNAYLWPFGLNTFTGSICTLIFTDSHWQQVGGNWV